jgi:hypothetical protein
MQLRLLTKFSRLELKIQWGDFHLGAAYCKINACSTIRSLASHRSSSDTKGVSFGHHCSNTREDRKSGTQYPIFLTWNAGISCTRYPVTHLCQCLIREWYWDNKSSAVAHSTKKCSNSLAFHNQRVIKGHQRQGTGGPRLVLFFG